MEVFDRGQRAAAHARRYAQGPTAWAPCPTTCRARTGPYSEWNPERFQSQARAIGPNTEALIIAVLTWRPHPEQGFRTVALSILVPLSRALMSSERRRSPSVRSRSAQAQLPECRLHPRASAGDQDGDAHRGQLADLARQYPRFPLLPLRRTTLLQHPTIDRLRELGLVGMAKSLRDLMANPESSALDHMEWLGILLEHEMTRRQQKRFEARARTAKLRHLASVEDIDYRAAGGLDPHAILEALAGCDWIHGASPLPPGLVRAA